MAKIEENIGELEYLLLGRNPRVRKKILADADKSLIDALCECCKNILDCHFRVSKEERHRLEPYKHLMREVVKKKVPLYKKKEIFQKGGFLPALLAPLAAPLLAPLASKVMDTLFG